LIRLDVSRRTTEIEAMLTLPPVRHYAGIFHPSDRADIWDAPDRFDIAPKDQSSALAGDYNRTAMMIFGDAPAFSAIRDKMRDLEPRGAPTR
jgi:hypothetical protein